MKVKNFKSKQKIFFLNNSIIWHRVNYLIQFNKYFKNKYEFNFFFSNLLTQKYSFSDEKSIEAHLISKMRKEKMKFKFINFKKFFIYLINNDFHILIGGYWDSFRDFIFILLTFLIKIIKKMLKKDFNWIIWSNAKLKNKFTIKETMANIILKYIIFKNVNLFICAGKRHKKYLIKTFNISNNKIIIIPNINVLENKIKNKIKNKKLNELLQTKKFKIAFIGRANLKLKGVNYLIKSFKKIRKKNKNTILLIIGSEKNYADEINQIYYFKAISPLQIARIYKNINLLVLPSIEDKKGMLEGWGLVVNEAFQFGVPAIVTNKVGAVEIIKNYKTGFVVKEKDSMDLANKIDILIKNKKLYKKISTNVKKLFEKELRYEKVMKKWKKIFKICEKNNQPKY